MSPSSLMRRFRRCAGVLLLAFKGVLHALKRCSTDQDAEIREIERPRQPRCAWTTIWRQGVILYAVGTFALGLGSILTASAVLFQASRSMLPLALFAYCQATKASALSTFALALICVALPAFALSVASSIHQVLALAAALAAAEHRPPASGWENLPLSFTILMIYHAATLPLAVLLLDTVALSVLAKFLIQRAVSLALLLGLVVEAPRSSVNLPLGSR